jgi:tRNA dimethylallyltransferase
LKKENKYNCVVVLGPTASGKTSLACRIAARFNGEIISADSRQVYKKLELGAGKDLGEYEVGGLKIAYHLIDIAEPSEQFYLHEFQRLLEESFTDIVKRQRLPVICGGTGLYLDALRKDYQMTRVPENPALRKQLEGHSREDLLRLLQRFPAETIKQVDVTSAKRLIRGIELAEYMTHHGRPEIRADLPYRPFYIGITISREELDKNIGRRLEARLKQGLVEEVQNLLMCGVSHQRLQRLGLEYKFISDHLQEKLSFEEMKERLHIAIRHYAKRQMTWFRKMEKEGVTIVWVDLKNGLLPVLQRLTEEFTETDGHPSQPSLNQ